jgi:LmbE family N-acetylglucosaminyl deacetylase
MQKEKLLIVEAHSDDSAISISGFLDKNRDRYQYHFLLMALSDINMHHAGMVTRAQRETEYADYVNYFDGIWHREAALPLDADSQLDQIPKRQLVSLIESVIEGVKPETLICQGPSFHHDHSLVYEATVAATRPTARFFPQQILVMENPTYVHSIGPQTDFKPDMYVSLTEQQMQAKLECFRKYFPSQIRKNDNYLSEEGIRSWARYRGIEARCQYAEALKTFIRVI